MFWIGIVLGLIYGILNIPNFIKEFVIIRIICDIIFVSFFTLSFIYLVELINLGSIRAYLFIGYLLGFGIERTTLGKLFAKGYKKVYNLIILGSKRFKKSKLGNIIFK